MATPASPFVDQAEPILSAEPSITQADKENLWDIFHTTKDANDLADKLAPIVVPDQLKHKLWQAKQTATPAVAPVDKVTDVIKRMTQLDPQALAVAEAHPNVLKALTSAATTPEKAAGVDSGTSSSKSKGIQVSESKKPTLAPRLDGQPHFPAIPDAHHRVLSSDGGVYDIPQERIEDARALDPNLHVLNP